MMSVGRSALLLAVLLGRGLTTAGQERRTYDNRLTAIRDPRPILADHPQYVAPVTEAARFEAAPLIQEERANLHVRAWRFSYNARGIIEIPNQLRADRTAVIVVHPWGIDDGQGWRTPQPAGCAFQCTPIKNQLCLRHVEEVVNPFLKSLRGKVRLIGYSLPGLEDPIRRKLYRSVRGRPTEAERRSGARDLHAALHAFSYQGQPLPEKLVLSADKPLADYFAQFPGLDAGDRYNAPGFWNLPIPVVRQIEVDPKDVVFYDGEGYEPLKSFLQQQGVRHILLAGYNTDMCVIRTTAGYQNLGRDFNVFLVGDATLATFPANASPAAATNAAVSFAALNLLITQVSWIQ